MKVEVPRSMVQMREELSQAKVLMQRLDKGQTLINQFVETRSVVEAQKAIALFNQLAKDLNDQLERALFIHETLATGRTTVVNRKGRAVHTLEYPADETVEVDLFILESIKAIKEVLGEEFIKAVELVN